MKDSFENSLLNSNMNFTRIPSPDENRDRFFKERKKAVKEFIADAKELKEFLQKNFKCYNDLITPGMVTPYYWFKVDEEYFDELFFSNPLGNAIMRYNWLVIESIDIVQAMIHQEPRDFPDLVNKTDNMYANLVQKLARLVHFHHIQNGHNFDREIKDNAKAIEEQGWSYTVFYPRMLRFIPNDIGELRRAALESELEKNGGDDQKQLAA